MTVAKFLAALFFAVLTALSSVFTDGQVTNVEWVQIGIAAATAAGVWIAANVPSMTWAKTAVAVVLAALNFLVTAIDGGLTTAELINLGLAAAGVLAVYFVPNKPTATLVGA